MTSQTTSATSSNPQVQSQIPTIDINTLNVDATARQRLSQPPSPTSERLRSNEQARDRILIEKYNLACQVIDSDPTRAGDLFLEITNDTPKVEANLLLLADCNLWLASLYSDDIDERNQFVASAKNYLDQAYANRSAWDSLGEEEKICNYKHLRNGLQQVNEMLSTHDNFIEFDIEECNNNIPLLSDYYDKLNEGALLKGDQARDVFNDALHMINSHEGPDYLLARAFGLARIALTYHPDDSNPCSAAALEQATRAYEAKEALYTNDQAKLTTLNLFGKLFDNLIPLFSDSNTLAAINQMHEKCNEELGHYQSKDGAKVKPRVSKEPVDQWKTVRLMIAFGFAALVIAGAFVLGRRYITRLN